jgi:hypothetical protein
LNQDWSPLAIPLKWFSSDWRRIRGISFDVSTRAIFQAGDRKLGIRIMRIKKFISLSFDQEYPVSLRGILAKIPAFSCGKLMIRILFDIHMMRPN